MSNGFWSEILIKLLGNIAADSNQRVHIKISNAGKYILIMKILLCLLKTVAEI